MGMSEIVVGRLGFPQIAKAKNNGHSVTACLYLFNWDPSLHHCTLPLVKWLLNFASTQNVCLLDFTLNLKSGFSDDSTNLSLF